MPEGNDPRRDDPGLAGVVPFRFECHRCGRCCSAGEGAVWLAEGEADELARRLSMDPGAFRRTCVRALPDPATGRLRESLVERDGRCVLLEGTNHCRAYEARPEHCRRFPYWDAVLADPEAFERARAVCPGIAVEPGPERRAAAFARLAALYAELDDQIARLSPRCALSGTCCRFEEAGHELFATALEADYAAARHPDAPSPEADGRCPYHVAGRCTARHGRALGCRTYFCDETRTDELQALHERFLAALRRIERETGYPAAYARFPALLAARGIGTGGKTAAAPASEGP